MGCHTSTDERPRVPKGMTPTGFRGAHRRARKTVCVVGSALRAAEVLSVRQNQGAGAQVPLQAAAGLRKARR